MAHMRRVEIPAKLYVSLPCRGIGREELEHSVQIILNRYLDSNKGFSVELPMSTVRVPWSDSEDGSCLVFALEGMREVLPMAQVEA
jgi:hypothetical protein